MLYAIVFTTRYLDLFTNFVSYYNTFMKVVFILCTYATLALILWKFRTTYDSESDSFRAEVLVFPAAGLAVLVNHEFTVMEVSWSSGPGHVQVFALSACMPLRTEGGTRNTAELS